MSSSRSGTARGGHPSDCIAELSLRLANAIRETRAPQKPLKKPHCFSLNTDHTLFVFSTQLLKALLTESPSISNLPGLLSVVHQQRDKINHALERASLRSLAEYLLRSPAEDGCELGLSLLVGEPKCLLDTVSMGSQINVPQLDHLLQLAQGNLVLKVYTIFINESSTAQLRRISGKVLAELLYDSEGNCQIIEELANKDSARPIINTLECPDTVLSFFASAILRRLYSSRTGNAPPWGPDNSYSRMMNDPQLEDNDIKQYYSYARVKRQPSSGERVTLPTYCLLESDGESNSGLPQGFVLLGMDEGRLNFLHCNEDAPGCIFTYMVLQPIKSSKNRCVVASGGDGGKLLLSLHIDARDSVMINNQGRCLQVVNFGIATENDLTNLKRGLDATGILNQRQRRSSSVMIPLDDLDQIDQIDRKFSQSSYSSSAKTTTDQATYAATSLNEPSHPVDELDHVSETSHDSSRQSPLTEPSRTPTEYMISSSRKQRTSQPISPEISRANGVTKKSAISEHVVPLGNLRTRRAKAHHTNDVNNMQETEPNEGQTSISEPARITRSRASQSGTDVSASTGPKYGRSNTQESLVFTTHRPKGKLYTALSKTAAGHTEDPETSEGSGEQGHQVDTELSSVPSPLPGGTGLNLHKKSEKRGNAGCTSRSAASKPKGQSNGGIKRKGKAKPKKPEKRAGALSPTMASTENDKPLNGQHADVLVEASQRNAAANEHECDSSPLPEMSDQLKDSIDARNFPKNTRRKAFAASALSKQDCSNGLIAGASRSLVQLETSRNLNRILGSSTNTESNSDKQQSSVQTVAEKLIAVLEESGILPEHFDEDREIENNAQDILIPEEPHTYNSLFSRTGMQGTSSPQEACTSLQGTTMVDPRSTISLGETQNSSLQTGTDRYQPNKNPRKRAGIFGKTGYGLKRPRKTLSLVTTSSIEPRSTQSTIQIRQMRPANQPKEDSRTAFPFHEISGNASVDPQMPGLTDTNLSDNISAGNETENRCLAPGKPLHSTQRKGHNLAGISLEPNFKITIDKNGSPRRSQGKSEQLTVPQRAPSSTKTIARGIAEPGAVNSAPQTATSRSEKQSSPDRESVSKVALPNLIELSKMPQERQHLTDGNDRQGEDLRSSSTSELLSRMVAPDSKRAFGLTSDTTHRQTLLQELHKEVERTLLNTDEQLHRYIEAERMAVNEVLKEYRNTINRVVEAQTKRITLCQQEKASIMQEYAICQGPGPHLQEDLGKGA